MRDRISRVWAEWLVTNSTEAVNVTAKFLILFRAYPISSLSHWFLFEVLSFPIARLNGEMGKMFALLCHLDMKKVKRVSHPLHSGQCS